MRYRPIQAAARERVPISLWGRSKARTVLAAVAASAAALVPALAVATPAQAATSATEITVSDAANWEGSGVTFKLTYTGTAGGAYVLDLDDGADTNTDATGGTTLGGGVDYDDDTLTATGAASLSTMTLTFPPSSATNPSTAYVTVATGNDADQADEYFTLDATGTDTTTKTATGTIWASANNTFPTFYLLAPTTVPEAQANARLTATLSRTMEHDITVPVSSGSSSKGSNQDAVSTGGANRDFTAPSATAAITIPAGQLSGYLDVPINDDIVDEAPTQYFRLTAGTTPGATVPSPAYLDVGITDNDATPALSVGDAPAVAEGGKLAFPVSLTSLSELTVTATLTPGNGVDTNTTHGATGSVAGGAANDFTSTAVPVSIPAYNPSVNALVPTTDDTVVEGNETMKVTLSNPSNATLGTPTTATGTLTDNADDVGHHRGSVGVPVRPEAHLRPERHGSERGDSGGRLRHAGHRQHPRQPG